MSRPGSIFQALLLLLLCGVGQLPANWPHLPMSKSILVGSSMGSNSMTDWTSGYAMLTAKPEVTPPSSRRMDFTAGHAGRACPSAPVSIAATAAMTDVQECNTGGASDEDEVDNEVPLCPPTTGGPSPYRWSAPACAAGLGPAFALAFSLALGFSDWVASFG